MTCETPILPPPLSSRALIPVFKRRKDARRMIRRVFSLFPFLLFSLFPREAGIRWGEKESASAAALGTSLLLPLFSYFFFFVKPACPALKEQYDPHVFLYPPPFFLSWDPLVLRTNELIASSGSLLSFFFLSLCGVAEQDDQRK